MVQKIQILFAVLLFFSVKLSAQSPKYYPNSYIKAVKSSGDTIRNAFAGGLSHPMFSNIDLNNDGLQDLVIFERSFFGSKLNILTFLSTGKGITDFLYAPQYISYFPECFGWAFLVDYNADGKPDLFTMTNPKVNTTGLIIYKNTSSSSKVEFTKYLQDVTYKTSKGTSKFSLAAVEIPAFVDVDFDGDIDMLTFAGEGNSVRYYQNMSVEYDLGKEAIEFSLKDQCWGKFYELDSLGLSNSVGLGYNCSNYLVEKKQMHSGSTILAFDMDNDKDMDVVIADASYPNFIAMTNGKKNGSSSHPIDSMILKKPFFPNNLPVEIYNMPLGFFVDVDNDGILDMVASGMEVGNFPRENFTWYYHNDGSNEKPLFSFREKNFLSKSIIDIGNYSVPTFFDYNNDGLPDLLLKSESEEVGDFTGTKQTYFSLYVNIGTKDKAVFKSVTDDYLNFSDSNYRNVYPCMADLDGDGKIDLLIGHANGEIMFYKNVTTGTYTKFKSMSQRLMYDDNGVMKPIDVGNVSMPTVGDVDGDGKADLVIGSSGGRLFYFRQKGEQNSVPYFELMSDAFAGVDGSNYFYVTAPCLADLNRNGKVDLILGRDSGDLRIYMDVHQQTAPYQYTDNNYFDFGLNSFQKTYFSNYSTPTVAFLDGDSIPDIVIGNYSGGVFMMTSQNHGIDTLYVGIKNNLNKSDFKEFKVYPNPAKDIINISYHLENVNSAPTSITLKDITGRLIYTQDVQLHIGNNETSIQTQSLSTGVYIISVYNAKNENMYNTKVLINK